MRQGKILERENLTKLLRYKNNFSCAKLRTNRTTHHLTTLSKPGKRAKFYKYGSYRHLATSLRILNFTYLALDGTRCNVTVSICKRREIQVLLCYCCTVESMIFHLSHCCSNYFKTYSTIGSHASVN